MAPAILVSLAKTAYSVSSLIKLKFKSSMVAAERIKGARPKNAKSAKDASFSPCPSPCLRWVKRLKILFVRIDWFNKIGFLFILSYLRLNFYMD